MTEKTKEQIAQEYVDWFFANADFGPADGDVRIAMQDAFEEETGLTVPDGWRYE